MRPLRARALSWVMSTLPLLVFVAACDQSATEPGSTALSTRAGQGGGGAAKPGLIEKIAFGSDHQGFSGIYVVDPNGQSPATLVTMPPAGMVDREPSLAPGSTKILFSRSNPATETSEIYSANLAGQVQQLTNFQVRTHSPALSPDGKKIAFISDKSHPGAVSQVNLYVMNSDGSNVQLVDSTRRGSRPSWSADGKTVFYSVAGTSAGTYYTWLAKKELVSGTRTFFMGCPNAECTNPVADYQTGRVIYEFQPSGILVPELWMYVNDSTNVNLYGLPPAKVGGWNKDGTRFVFAPVNPTTSAMQILDVTTIGSGSLSFSDLPTAASWVDAPTWSR
jgi:dipeptidyl aminopeptidase/acylaminoacyl peptidase